MPTEPTYKYSWQVDACGGATDAGEDNPIPQPPPTNATPADQLVEPVAAPPGLVAGRFGAVERHAVQHIVWAYPYADRDDDRVEVTGIVESIQIDMEINKDTDVKISLVDHAFQLTDLVYFSVGHRLGIELFDGVKWRDFGSFVIVNPQRDYSDTAKINLDLRTKKVVMQRNSNAQRWEKTKRSKAVEDIAKAYGFDVEMDETDLEVGEITMANEPPTAFIQRIAKLEGFWWDVVGNKIRFKKRTLKDTGVILRYRPDWPEVGNIISVSSETDGSSGKGSKAIPDAVSIDFQSGELDPNYLQVVAQLGLFNTQGNVVASIADKAGYQAPNSNDFSLLASLQQFNTNTEEPEDKGSVLDEPVSYNPPSMMLQDARTANAMKKMKDILYESNALGKYKLSVSTYANNDIEIEGMVTVNGKLSVEDQGLWMVETLSVGFGNGGYMMELGCKRGSRPEIAKGTVRGSDSANGEAAQDRAFEENDPDNPWDA